MAIIKKELNAEEIKKLSEEELKEVDGGLIRIEEKTFTNVSDGSKYTVPIYRVINDYTGENAYCYYFSSLEAAIKMAEADGYSTEIIDARKQK